MMMQFVSGLALWTIASVGLGLIFGTGMRGAAVGYLPVPVRETEGKPPYQRTA